MAVSSRQMVRGYVRLYKHDGFQKHKDYEFANAYILHFHESFNATNSRPITCKIIISPDILKVNDSIHENEWNPSNPFQKQTPLTTRDDLVEPELLKGWWATDSKDYNLITDANIGDSVYFHVQTKGIKIGEQINCWLWGYDHFLV